jgi:hypothetical protein
MNRLISKLRPRTAEGNGSGDNGVRHVRVTARGTRSRSRSRYVVTAAETAPCTCPEFCERDHANE